MLSKFETKSNRVKGLSFHPKRPWVLSSLHNGSIQLWDYKMGTLIDRFDEHEGPVRGISFHQTQPLFASGGDDYKIKLWNWKQRRCLFTLNGHLDYIRTVFFHHEYPWIISCADDQTIRIWNWQSRTCISILTGHNHYVMCAQFHPKDDLIVSASLDQTIRVWDFTGLRKKHAAPGGANNFDQHISRSSGGPGGAQNQPGDIFGNTDVVVKYVLEGHDRGVNWVSFHPTLPLIVSGADDRQVKLWRMSETKAWEVDTCRGHYNNVSSVVFHPRQELIISNSEDKTIRVWDMTKRTALQNFRKEHDRYWVLAAHPELNLFAAGHDSGLIVFKLERERPALTIHENRLFYIKDKFIRMYDFTSSTDTPVLAIKRTMTNGANDIPRTISYNPTEHSVIFCSKYDGDSYEMYSLPRDMSGGDPREGAGSDAKRGKGSSAIFVARNRFAVLDVANAQINIKDLKNEITKQFKAPAGIVDMFYAGTRNLLLNTATSVILFDTELRTNVAELSVPAVRYVIWSTDMSMVAFVSKHTIVIANRKLEQLCQIHETIKIKSGAWDDMGIFVYTTLNHIKYALPQGDNGIIRTLEQPVYLCRVKGNNVYCLDRDGKIRIISIDPTEYRFKLALVSKKYDEVLNIIRNSNLVGQSIIAYLEKKGYPEVALQFVKDPKTRFELAIECGNIEVALETAKVLDTAETWVRLGDEALNQGNHQVLEMTYQRVKNFDRLSFLYLSTGSTEKLKKMMKIAEIRGDGMSRFHNSLYLGDVEEQIKLLKEVGQYPLAYLSAKTHGLEEEAANILELAGLTEPPVLPPNFGHGELLKGPTPILRESNSNWPLLAGPRGFFEPGYEEESKANPVNNLITPPVVPDGGNWGDEDDFDIKSPSIANGDAVDDIVFDEGDGWDVEGDLEIPAEALAHVAAVESSSKEFFVAPSTGTSIADFWCRNSGLSADHAAAGNFESAMQLLNRQVGITHFAPLKPYFMNCFQAAKSQLECTSGVPSLTVPLLSHWSEDNKKILPAHAYTLAKLTVELQEAYGMTTMGKFVDALLMFKKILLSCLFVVVEKPSEIDEVQELLNVCREYILGIRMELHRKDLNPETDSKRALELAAYFTHCQLQSAHLQLSLRSAMIAAYKLKNFSTTIVFARRLLELGPSSQSAAMAKKLLTVAERTPTDEVALLYDQYNPFVVCGTSFTPIYRGSTKSVTCPFCKSHYLEQYSGQICGVCEVGCIGETGTGLRSTV